MYTGCDYRFFFSNFCLKLMIMEMIIVICWNQRASFYTEFIRAWKFIVFCKFIFKEITFTNDVTVKINTTICFIFLKVILVIWKKILTLLENLKGKKEKQKYDEK